MKCSLSASLDRRRAVPSPDMPNSSDRGSTVSDPQHSQKLLRVLRTFWQEQSFHDALLVVDGEELPVQKNILAAASPYIRSENSSCTQLITRLLFSVEAAWACWLSATGNESRRLFVFQVLTYSAANHFVSEPNWTTILLKKMGRPTELNCRESPWPSWNRSWITFSAARWFSAFYS